jgi:hypothetical protein
MGTGCRLEHPRHPEQRRGSSTALLLTWPLSGSHARPRLHLWPACEHGDHSVSTSGRPPGLGAECCGSIGLTLTHHHPPGWSACTRRRSAAPLPAHPTPLTTTAARRPRGCLSRSRAGLHLLPRGCCRRCSASVRPRARCGLPARVGQIQIRACAICERPGAKLAAEPAARGHPHAARCSC